jgi:hydrogenase/urease accessory protein HupE
MTVFDRVCSVLAIPLGFVLMVLGVLGLFGGVSAHFTLPPILGGLPFFVGWAMSITLLRFWRMTAGQRRRRFRIDDFREF